MFSKIILKFGQKFSSLKVQQTHPEHIFYFDDATLQNGGAYRRDFDGSAVPGLPAVWADYVPTQCGHHSSFLLHGASGNEGLRLGDESFWHHGARSRVIEFSEDWNHFTWRVITTC